MKRHVVYKALVNKLQRKMLVDTVKDICLKVSTDKN